MNTPRHPCIHAAIRTPTCSAPRNGEVIHSTVSSAM